METENYTTNALIIGAIGFIIIWIFSMSQWGVLIGLLVGWVPALIGGFIIGLLWPLAIAVALIIGFILFAS